MSYLWHYESFHIWLTIRIYSILRLSETEIKSAQSAFIKQSNKYLYNTIKISEL